ncbi:Outer membrane receptor protein, mostly Fe transport [Methylacidimicrobium sp. AP8]|uniref:excisionase family DNA-binding protein n=1 Tax=Methylacidimicrobium sp. AP8 TaxID=2730359 RepID=UPI0018C16710|nr:excisionase family DNA-binding protein [Methylacidimicrobium sp. AP8]CAB4242820.1 Outer membrane receptor protein, mostly Fe transport [Methylacidimicrobium sp. AP8]
MHKKLLRPDEAARMLSVSRWTVYRWVGEGRLEGTRVGPGSLRVFAESVDRLIDGNRVGESAGRPPGRRGSKGGRCLAAVLGFWLLVHGPLWAQLPPEVDPPADVSGASGGSGTKAAAALPERAPESTMAPVTVKAAYDVPQMLPTAAPTDSVYGMPMDVMDIPRQVTPINKTLMEEAGINAQGGYVNPISFAMINPTAFGGVDAWISPSPYIRGDAALPFINGMAMSVMNVEMVNSGLPWNWNMVESVDMVEGPGNAVFGAGQESSGYVNYVTKQPYFDKFRGNAWGSMGMYQQYMWGGEMGGPIDKEHKLAYRLSYMGIESGSWYQTVHNDQQNVYLALGWKPVDNYSADLYVDADFASFSPIGYAGFNRPTNALFQSGGSLDYLGALPPSQWGSVPYFQNYWAANPGAPVAPSPVGFGTYGVGLGPVNRRQLLMSPYAQQTGYQGMTQLIQKVHVDEGFDLVNNTLVWYTRHDALNPSYLYDEAVMGDYEVDNRTECRLAFDTPVGGSGSGQGEKAPFAISHNVDTGFEWVYQRNQDYVSTMLINAPNMFSLAQNPMLWDVRNTPYFQAAIMNPNAPGGGEWPIPNGPAGYYFEPLNGTTGTTDSQYWALAPFWQHVINFGEKLSLQYGLRATTYLINAQTPPGTPPMLSTQLQTSMIDPLFSIGPVYKPFPWLSLYGNFNYEYVTAAADMGGFVPTQTSQEMHLLNELGEVGAKLSLLHDKLYLSFAFFHQNLYMDQIGFPPNPGLLQGFEYNMTYQPDRHWWFRAGYAYMHGTWNFSSLPYGPSQTQSYSTGYAFRHNLPLDDNGTAVAPVNVSGIPGIYDWIGLPNQTANAMVTYRTDFGLSLTASALVMSSYPLFYNYTAVVPTQYVTNLSVTYQKNNWSLTVYLWNTLNSVYWLPYASGLASDVASNSDYVAAGWPFWIQGTLSYQF